MKYYRRPRTPLIRLSVRPSVCLFVCLSVCHKNNRRFRKLSSEDDEVIDGEHEIISIDDDEVDIPSLPGESKIDSAQVDAWARRLPGNKAVPHGLARERIVRSQEKTRGMNRR